MKISNNRNPQKKNWVYQCELLRLVYINAVKLFSIFNILKLVCLLKQIRFEGILIKFVDGLWSLRVFCIIFYVFHRCNTGLAIVFLGIYITQGCAMCTALCSWYQLLCKGTINDYYFTQFSVISIYFRRNQCSLCINPE